MTEDGCPFCAIVADRSLATIVHDWPGRALAFLPLNPVVKDLEDGHVLVVPTVHARDFTVDPDVFATAAHAASELGRKMGGALNLITSAGSAATQTVFHLHVHLVRRRHGDGLSLPWTPLICADGSPCAHVNPIRHSH